MADKSELKFDLHERNRTDYEDVAELLDSFVHFGPDDQKKDIGVSWAPDGHLILTASEEAYPNLSRKGMKELHKTLVDRFDKEVEHYRQLRSS
ncbi:MAG: hypothetical protein ACYTF6_11545 [Planctomycetota bacterium]|jgi:hypothetical protein